MFILKHIGDSEFIILWTSGEKKITVVNLFLLAGISALIFYLLMSTILTPLALNKSRQLLNNDKFNSFLPTIKSQQFSDSFNGLTFIVDQKSGNQVKNIFLQDNANVLKNLSSKKKDISSNTIIAKSGLVDDKSILLFEGKSIISAIGAR